MLRRCVLTALLCGLWLTTAQAKEDCRVKMVPTVIGVTVTDSTGQPLVSPDSIVQVIWDQFGKKPWPEEYWATMSAPADSGHVLSPTRFPIDGAGLRYLWWYAKFFHKPRIMIGFYLRDGHGQPLLSGNHVHIVLWQLGADPWPRELWVTIAGRLDERGHIVVPVNFPLNGLVVKNLTALARNPEQ